MPGTLDMEDWERRCGQAWEEFVTYEERGPAGEAEFRQRIDALARELGPDSGIGLFERASAEDSTGREERAVALYREALERGLRGLRRRRAVIQLASSLRNIGRAAEGVALLEHEVTVTDPEDAALDSAVAAFLALCLVDADRGREAVSVALAALVPYLTRYQRSVDAYARLLVDPPT